MRVAMLWHHTIENEGINRAEMARRAGVSRARVTQLLSLLKLPKIIRKALLDEDENVVHWSIKRALRLVTAGAQSDR